MLNKNNSFNKSKEEVGKTTSAINIGEGFKALNKMVYFWFTFGFVSAIAESGN